MAEKKPGHQSGGVNFNTSGGKVTIGGDVVGGDKITTTNYGMDPRALAELVKQFQKIQAQIDALPGKDEVDKQELKETVKKIEEEAKKGDQAKPDRVERWLMNVGVMSDDIFQVTTATLANPVYGVFKTLQLIAQKAKEEKAKLDARR
jgi:predicted transcriptional regulator